MEENTETMTFTVELTDWGFPPPQKKTSSNSGIHVSWSMSGIDLKAHWNG